MGHLVLLVVKRDGQDGARRPWRATSGSIVLIFLKWKLPYNICFIPDMAVRTLAGCVAELFGPAASPAPPANGSRCSETAALCPIAPGRYSMDLEAIWPTRARRPFLRATMSIGVAAEFEHPVGTHGRPTDHSCHRLAPKRPPRAVGRWARIELGCAISRADSCVAQRLGHGRCGA